MLTIEFSGVPQCEKGKSKKTQRWLPVNDCLSSNSVSHENPHKENAQVHTVSMIVLRKINNRQLWYNRAQGV